MPNDAETMQQALALARETAALASPNPQVGCVLKINNQIIGRGAHLYQQRDHAEIVALKQASALGHSTRGATAYVTLEPCSHHGRTGPCADALIAAGITRCVIATADPNPQVAGQGIARLRTASIAVTLGICEPEARTLNNAFAFSITHGRPFVTLKAALSTDGMLAPHPSQRNSAEPRWLTGPLARADVQHLRHTSDAILTGIGTVLADNPSLTDRTNLPRRRPLLRVVLDSNLRTPIASNVVRTANADLLLFCKPSASAAQRSALEARGVEVICLSTPHLGEILGHLHQRQCLSVLVEAGSQLNAAFLRDRLVDQAILYYAPVELGPSSIPFAQGSLTPFQLEQQFLHISKQTLGPDVRVSGLIHNPWADLPTTS